MEKNQIWMATNFYNQLAIYFENRIFNSSVSNYNVIKSNE